MTVIKQWYSAAELADMKLPLLPETKKGVLEKADREGWPRQKRAGRGGGFEYQPPKAVMDAIREQALHSMVKGAQHETNKNDAHGVPTRVAQNGHHSGRIPPATTNSRQMAKAGTNQAPAIASIPAALKDWQRTTAEARAAICAEVRRLADAGGTERAIRTIITLAEQGQLPEHLQQMVPVANARAGANGTRTLSRTSIFRWLKESEGGVAKLAPKQREAAAIPAWAPYLLALYRQPQKPALKWVMEQLPDTLPAGIEAPSYFAANRFINKISKTEVQRGRMGSREIKNIRPFVRRDTSQMWPGDAYTADGHTFDAEVAHPAHGKAFRPEITSVLDIGTRRAVGWSAGLAESTWAVLDALRHACLTGGIPAIFYVDNGSGYKNAAMSAEATGFLARIGATLTHSLPYNSQARGIEERSHQSIWVRGAKTLPTYMGADMDREAKQKAFKVTRADLRLVGSSRLLMPWNDFVQWCQEQVDAYNNRPHRALPKIRDAETGKMRHQTPNEAWQQAIDEGWKHTPVEQHEADDLFRPYKEAKTTRAEVRLFGNLYFHPDLEHYHGETVRVGYDIHDASHVWVRDLQGRLICVAGFEANKRSYFPQSFIEQAAEKRAKGRIKRAEARIDEAMEELSPPQLLEHQPTIELPVMAINTPCEKEGQPAKATVEIGKSGQGNVLELPRKAARPMFDTDAGKYRWLMSNADQMTPEDAGWLGWYRTTSEWEDLFGDIEVAAR